MGVNGEASQLNTVHKNFVCFTIRHTRICISTASHMKARISMSYPKVLFKALISPIGKYIIHNYMCMCTITLATP